MQELDDAYAHIESASPEQLRTALNQVARDRRALSPLLMIAAPGLQSNAGPALATWLAAMRRPRYAILAVVALIAGLGMGSIAAGRACSAPAPGNANFAFPNATSPVFGPQSSGDQTAATEPATTAGPTAGAPSATASIAATEPPASTPVIATATATSIAASTSTPATQGTPIGDAAPAGAEAPNSSTPPAGDDGK